MARVVCAGHVNWDVTLFVDRLPGADEEAVVTDRTEAGGGSAANTAAALATLGVTASLMGSVGADEVGRRVRRDLDSVGVDCETLRTVVDTETTVKYLLVDEAGEVAVLSNDGANEAFEAADLPDAALEAADRLHLTGQRPATARALAGAASNAGVPVSIDPGRRLAERDFEPALARADLVFLNDTEARRARDAGLLDGFEGAVVTKRGAGGAELRRDATVVEHPGFAVDSLDTTGAGDAFAAGFLAARCADADDERALAVANACGALAAEHVGARAPLTWEAVWNLVDGRA